MIKIISDQKIPKGKIRLTRNNAKDFYAKIIMKLHLAVSLEYMIADDQL